MVFYLAMLRGRAGVVLLHLVRGGGGVARPSG